jgi:hypothetical protein
MTPPNLCFRIGAASLLTCCSPALAIAATSDLETLTKQAGQNYDTKFLDTYKPK